MPLAPSRKCTECGGSLEGKLPSAKTCGHACRARRSRRLKRQNAEAGRQNRFTEAQRELHDRIESEKEDAIHSLIQEEIAPVVRESITEDTLRAIAKMVGLTPVAVEAIQADLGSANDSIRQRAYTLVLKYTVGNPAVIQPEEDDKSRPLQINFALPRPDAIESEAVEIPDDAPTKQCDKCGEDKHLSEFVSGSDRCKTCYEAGQLRAREILGT